MDIPSGLHKYTGDPVHLKLRLVFTNPDLFENRPGKKVGNKSSDQHQSDQLPHRKQQQPLDQNNQKNCHKSPNDVQNDAHYRATYLLKRSNDLATNKWDIEEVEQEEEEDNDEEKCVGGDNLPELTSSSSSRRFGEQNKSIAAILRQTGFKLRVVNVPTSRNACPACSSRRNTALANNRSATLIETQFSGSDINLERGTRKSPDRRFDGSTNQHDNLTREHMVEKLKSNDSLGQSLQDRDDELIVENLFVNRQRAFSWKDTTDVTSAYDHNDYLKRIQARSLTANTRIVSDWRTNKAGGVPNRPVSLLMRNHYRPHYDPCHCSPRIAACQSSNAPKNDNYAAREALSFLCCSCKRSIRESAHLNLDRGKDNLNFPTTRATSMVASVGCCRSAARLNASCRCFGCRCNEFNEGYKCWLKLYNKTNRKDVQQLDASSSSGFVQADANAREPIEKVHKATDRIQVKDDDDNSDTFDLMLSGLDGSASADISCLNVTDSFKEIAPKNDYLCANTISEDYNLINQKLIEEWKKLYTRSADHEDDDEMAQNITGCLCSQPHGETLFLVLEKYTQNSENLIDNFTSGARPRDSARRRRQRVSTTEGNTDNSPSNSNKRTESKSIDVDVDNGDVVGGGMGDNDEIVDKKSESGANRSFDTRGPVKHGSPSVQESVEWQRINFTGPTDKSQSTQNDSVFNRGIGGASSSSALLSGDSEPRVESVILVTNRDESNGQYHNDNDNNRDRDNKSTIIKKNEQSNPAISDTIVECNTSRAQQAQLQSPQRRQRQRQLNALSQFTGEVDGDNNDSSNSSGSMISVEQQRQGPSELECSILLAVIVIDVFNMTVEMKPDLNRLIMIDLRDFVATSGGSERARDILPGVDDMRVITKDHPRPIEHNLTSLFYHVESVHTKDVEWKALNEQLGIARQRLGLIQQVQKFTSNHAFAASSTRATNVKDETLINGFLTPIDERVLIKLQYDVHYVYDLPADCHNVHVRHKLFVRHHARWNFKRYHETPTEAHAADGSALKRESRSNTHKQLTIATNGEAKKFNLLQHSVSIADGELKVDHMTHTQEASQRSSSSSSSSATAVAAATATATAETPAAISNMLSATTSRDFKSKATDWLRAPGLSGHEPQRLTTLSSLQIGENDSMFQDNDESSPLLLLLHEGSTVTSQRNAYGCFHLCCAEQIMLELSEKTKGGGQDNSVKVADQSACNNDKDDDDDARDMVREYGRKRHDDSKIDTKIVETNHSLESQQMAAEADGGVVATNQVDRRQPADRVDFSPIDVGADPFSRYPARDFHTSTPIASNTMTTNITNRDTGDDGGVDDDKTRNACLPPPSGKKTNHEVGRIVETSQKASSSSNHSKTTRSSEYPSRRHGELTSCNQKGIFSDDTRQSLDDNQICNLTLVLVFEIYSSDFYGDKLQGWSSVDVPVEIKRGSLMKNTSNGSKSCLSERALSLNGASIQMNRDNFVYASNKYNRTSQELPVIRPTFSTPLDRLRYYLTGRLPTMTPSIESFVSSTNRYMMQSEQNGKLVVDYQVTRQFSDVKLDEALRELVRSGSIKRISMTRTV